MVDLGWEVKGFWAWDGEVFAADQWPAAKTSDDMNQGMAERRRAARNPAGPLRLEPCLGPPKCCEELKLNRNEGVGSNGTPT